MDIKRLELIEKWKQYITEQTGDKYCGFGIYGIYCNDHLVYIGKSDNMLRRVAEHSVCIYDCYGKEAKGRKYQLLIGARYQGADIRFDVIEKTENNLVALGEAEAKQINDKLPILNYQIPIIGNSRRYNTNKRLKTLTINELLEGIDNGKF